MTIQRADLKEYFEANYLDGGKVEQGGCMIAAWAVFEAFQEAFALGGQCAAAKTEGFADEWDSSHFGGDYKEIMKLAAAILKATEEEGE